VFVIQVDVGSECGAGGNIFGNGTHREIHFEKSDRLTQNVIVSENLHGGWFCKNNRIFFRKRLIGWRDEDIYAGKIKEIVIGAYHLASCHELVAHFNGDIKIFVSKINHWCYLLYFGETVFEDRQDGHIEKSIVFTCIFQSVSPFRVREKGIDAVFSINIQRNNYTDGKANGETEDVENRKEFILL